MEAIENAKTDGRWDAAYDSPSSATVPDDFQAALDSNPGAVVFLRRLTGQTDMRFFGEFRPRKRRILAPAELRNLSQCWGGTRRFIPDFSTYGILTIRREPEQSNAEESEGSL